MARSVMMTAKAISTQNTVAASNCEAKSDWRAPLTGSKHRVE